MARRKRGAKDPLAGVKALLPLGPLFPGLLEPKVKLPKSFRPRGNIEGTRRRMDDPLEPPPRRRGRLTTHDWHSIDGEIARRCINPKSRRLEVPKSENKLAEDMLSWLSEQGIDPPAPSEMREAVKRICASLRTV